MCFDVASGNFLIQTHETTYLSQYINKTQKSINCLNAELNPICHLLALIGAHSILHVRKARVNRKYSESHFYASQFFFNYITAL